jgi:hypothetical protein
MPVEAIIWPSLAVFDVIVLLWGLRPWFTFLRLTELLTGLYVLLAGTRSQRRLMRHLLKARQHSAEELMRERPALRATLLRIGSLVPQAVVAFSIYVPGPPGYPPARQRPSGIPGPVTAAAIEHARRAASDEIRERLVPGHPDHDGMSRYHSVEICTACERGEHRRGAWHG